MCGIAGVFCADKTRPIDPAVLRRMSDSIAHRGPDADGFWIEPGLGLAHRRLAILDLEGGQQPIGNEDGSIQVVFNGEIYNFLELRQALEAHGHSFRTRTDTEVLVHLYEEEGEHLVNRLRGMFAFALWDRKRRQLVLARDRLGIKPLYVFQDGEKLIFGSELKAILAYPGIPRDIAVEALEDYLTFGMVPGARSIFRGVAKLPPAHVLVVGGAQWQRAPRRYWQLRLDPDLDRTAADWQDAIRAKMSETVRGHLIADVPVGAFLSGGLDSSVVVAACTGQTRDALQTFSMGFEDERFSELPYAREVAERFGTMHREEIVTPDAAALLDDLSHYYDEPFADSSAIPTFLVSRLARRHVKVALSGDGGDEAFGGYSRYAHDLREAAVRRCLPGWVRRFGLAPMAWLWPKADWLPRPLRAKTLLTNLALDPASAYANTISVCRPPLRRQLLSAAVTAELNGYQPEQTIRDFHRTASPDDALSGMIAADVGMVLPDDFLVKVDRASMAHGLEVRPPFLDHELFELAARVPSRFKVRAGHTKWIVKEAYREQLPVGAVDRPKHGFEIPVDDWLRRRLRDVFEDTVLAPRTRIAELVNPLVVRRLYREHLAGIGRHGPVLWALVVLARWADRYLAPSDGSWLKSPPAGGGAGTAPRAPQATSPSGSPCTTL